MAEGPIPPPVSSGNFASYPRAGFNHYGTSEKLRRLYRGYHGFSYAFLMIFVAVIFMVSGAIMTGNNEPSVAAIILFIFAALSYIGSFVLAAKAGMDIGYANGWSKGIGLVLGILAPFIGIIMFIVMQFLATSEMKNYGIVQRAFRGIKKADVEAKINELAALESRLNPGIISPRL